MKEPKHFCLIEAVHIDSFFVCCLEFLSVTIGSANRRAVFDFEISS